MVQKSGGKRSNGGSPSQSRLKQQKKNLVKDRIKSLEETTGQFLNSDAETSTPKMPPPKLKPVINPTSFNVKNSTKKIPDVETSATKSEKVAQAKTLPRKLKPTGDLPSCNDINASALDRAMEVQENLSLDFPSFLNPMLKSHVSGDFWLDLPRKFCVKNLPNADVTVALVDENGKESCAKYLVEKNGLSGGWRDFSIEHGLFDGDVLVFQLIKECTFKIYIVREDRIIEIDKDTYLQNLASQAEPVDSVKTVDSASEDMPTVDDDKTVNASEDMPTVDDAKTVNASEDMPTVDASEEHMMTPEIEHFTIHVDGLILDSEIPVHLRKKYHELCNTQGKILHENLIKGLNTKLAAGMISETISIAEAIRAIKSVSAIDQLESWDRTLKAFEDVGMGVGFIRTRIHILLSLYRDAQAPISLKKTRKAAVEDRMRELRMELSMAEVEIKSLDSDIKTLEEKNETFEFVFKEAAKTPW